MAARADLGVTRVEIADGADAIDGLRAQSLRGRLGIETARRFAIDDATGLVSFVELVGRQHVGDGLRATGLELAGGVRFSAPRLQVEARGRMLAVPPMYARERGLSLTVRLNPDPDRSGPSLALSPRSIPKFQGRIEVNFFSLRHLWHFECA